jgi:STE24 endopeptidase
MTRAMGPWLAVLLLLVWLTGGGRVQAQDLPPSQQLPPVAAPTVKVESSQLPVLDTTPQFDPASATDVYLARVSGAARARSDAYTDGNYGWALADFVYGLLVAGVLLWLKISARIRDWTQEKTRTRAYQVMLYGVIYVGLVTAASLPLSIYEGYVREHAYGLSNQTFLQWLGDFAKSFALTLIAAVAALPVFYAAIRRARESWWLWGAGLVVAFSILVQVIYPVFIAPLYNDYTPLPDSPLKQQIESLARANGVQADNIWLVDESRQSTRISANVSGFLGTTRISLNDNLLKRGTPDEVLAVLGHEMGHYVMGHMLRGILLSGLITLIGFGFVAFAFRLAAGIFGGNWQVREPDDVAGLPLLIALMSIFLFAAAPLTNSITRSMEDQADIFGVNAVRKPDAFATVVLKLADYRKLDPGPLEEAMFYDHPSGRTRIFTMMRWKKEHVRDLDIRDSVNGNPR